MKIVNVNNPFALLMILFVGIFYVIFLIFKGIYNIFQPIDIQPTMKGDIDNEQSD